MIKSMTGFGRGELQSKFGLFIVEIKTLNHKFLEVTPKLPNSLAIFDDRVKALVKNKIKIGKIYLNLIHETSQEVGGNVFIDEKLAKNYSSKLKKLKEKFTGLRSDTLPVTVARSGVRKVIGVHSLSVSSRAEHSAGKHA